MSENWKHDNEMMARGRRGLNVYGKKKPKHVNIANGKTQKQNYVW